MGKVLLLCMRRASRYWSIGPRESRPLAGDTGTVRTVRCHAPTHVFEDNLGFFAVTNGHKRLQPAAFPETLDAMA